MGRDITGCEEGGEGRSIQKKRRDTEVSQKKKTDTVKSERKEKETKREEEREGGDIFIHIMLNSRHLHQVRHERIMRENDSLWLTCRPRGVGKEENVFSGINFDLGRLKVNQERRMRRGGGKTNKEEVRKRTLQTTE